MRIAVGYLRSDEGRAALEAAIAEVEQRGGTLVIVHSMRGGERDEAEVVHEYDRALEAVTDDLAARGVPHEVKRYARGGSPAEDLLQTAHDEDVDLLVIGIRRRSPVGKLLLGSNSQDIILQADCPVLAVKPPRD
ncbi:universal stress protein [Salsipaludibacter albus]|uniref:universal stress protein n=1 Tax=Salsipaludibacter albus TaxID=2849650 RepID=UPI001EE40AF5|nr:universal stress protein [Salsipaludibacter albus]MBY5164216.1 universal stress protein [Salsipaludibacter albus]